MGPSYDLARLLPHRPPFLLIDRVLEADPVAGWLRAERLVSADEPLLRPRPTPHLPAVLLIDALCQAAACLAGLREGPGHRGVLAGLRGLTLGGGAVPGDRLVFTVREDGAFGALSAVHAEAHRDGDAAPLCAGRLLLAVTSP